MSSLTFSFNFLASLNGHMLDLEMANLFMSFIRMSGFNHFYTYLANVLIMSWHSVF